MGRVGEAHAPEVRREAAWQERWRPAPVLAAAVTSGVLAIRLVGAVAAGLVAAHSIGRPTRWWGWLLVWVVLGAVVSGVLAVTHRLAMRLAPFAVLLRMAVSFPDQVPSRFKVALRAGNSKALDARVRRAHEQGVLHGPAVSVGHMLELVAVLNHHDRATRGHSERVRAYTELIAEELGLGADEREQLRWAGLLHDVGKIRTPADILNKAGPLTDEEWHVIRRHPHDGEELAAPLRPWLGPALSAVGDHHERWAGGGYPRGHAGQDISLAGRIVAVADAYDVITSARSYKAPISVAAAREELVRCAGEQFDPAVVRAFLAISVRRLQGVLGLFGLGTVCSVLRWRANRLSMTALRGVAAVTIGGGLLVAVPADTTDAAAPAAVPVTSPTIGTGDRPREPRVASPAPASAEPTDPVAPLGPEPVASPVPATDTPVAGPPPAGPPTEDPAPPAPSDGSGGAAPTPGEGEPADPGEGDDQGRPVGVRIDPSEGEASLVGVPAVPGGSVPLVDVPAAGSILCDGASLCEPIEILLPIDLGGGGVPAGS